jgi:hypothetical protein
MTASPTVAADERLERKKRMSRVREVRTISEILTPEIRELWTPHSWFVAL